MVSTKEENIYLIARTKKEKKPFSPKNNFYAKKNDIHKGFYKYKILFFYCEKEGHFIWDFRERKRKEGRVHASIVVEETSKDASEEKETRREYYIVSDFFGSTIIGEDTWLIDSGASKHMSW